MKLEKEWECLSSPIGEIVYEPHHNLYSVNGNNYDGVQTTNSCGIWAEKKKIASYVS
ncbi:hypothetical protein AGMMS49921_02590 [Endomicrobiia bacterium]|nr:hypothetical protein AGMMS49921_02590 [Endomicrobiia bacterium]